MPAIYLANTDNSWFDFLSSQSAIDEVNFWRPSAQPFRTIQFGEVLAFRLKSPRNAIGGYGVFTTASVLPIETAWEAFGSKNGMSTIAELIAAIGNYSPDRRVSASTFIGCRVLVQPVFFSQRNWLPVPKSWSDRTVSGKRFSTDSDEGRELWESLFGQAATSVNALSSTGFAESESKFGAPTLVKPRLGQGAFRIGVIETYGRQCALTDGRVLPALDAAHIRPYAMGGAHDLSNGILLRKDIHSVFDAGYATFDDKMNFVVSSKVKEVFNNGEEYRRLHGRPLRLPEEPCRRPSIDVIRWHNENIFERF